MPERPVTKVWLYRTNALDRPNQRLDIRSLSALLLVWVVTRALLMSSLHGDWKFPGTDVSPDVWRIYHGWYEVLRSGSFPVNDVTWQYPPVTAAVILAPALLPFLSYAGAFYVLACVADFVVLLLLVQAGRAQAEGKGSRLAGAWLWVVGTAVLGPVVLARYDVMVTALAVGALLAAARHSRAAGVLTAIGALLKVWPVLVLVGVASGRAARRIWTTAAVAGVAVCALFLAFTNGAFGFLTEQKNRGVEIESVAALPFHIARYLGLWHGIDQFNYGSFEFLGPYVRSMAEVSIAVTALAFAWLVWWRFKARVFTTAVLYDSAFTAVLIFITTSRVISPQYMIWLLGLGGLCLTTRSTVQRFPVLLVLIACGFTVLDFPVGFGHVIDSDLPGIVVMLVRNGLLILASFSASRHLWRSAVPTGRSTAKPPIRTREEERALSG
jgi:Glycosyltransferase family 87